MHGLRLVVPKTEEGREETYRSEGDNRRRRQSQPEVWRPPEQEEEGIGDDAVASCLRRKLQGGAGTVDLGREKQGRRNLDRRSAKLSPEKGGTKDCRGMTVEKGLAGGRRLSPSAAASTCRREGQDRKQARVAGDAWRRWWPKSCGARVFRFDFHEREGYDGFVYPISWVSSNYAPFSPSKILSFT